MRTFLTSFLNFIIILKYRYAPILEEKSTNLNVVNRKKIAWDEICQHYNAISTSGPRSVMHLKIFFKNLKQKMRKEKTEEDKSNLSVTLNDYECSKTDSDTKNEPKIPLNLAKMLEEKKLNVTYIQRDGKGIEISIDNFRKEPNVCDYLETVINESSYDSEDYRRERSRNYTEEEKLQLVELIKKYAHIFEENSTNQKKLAWDEIAEQYNAICTTGPRTVESLKIFFKNLKQRLRKDLPECHKYSYSAMLNNADIAKICATKFNKCEEKDFLNLKQNTENKITENQNRIVDKLENKKISDFESDENSSHSEKKIIRCKRKTYTSTEMLKRIYLKKKIQLTNFQLIAAKKQHTLDMKIKKLQIKRLEDVKK